MLENNLMIMKPALPEKVISGNFSNINSIVLSNIGEHTNSSDILKF